MPKAAQYTANSVIYVQGDVAEKIFILKTGKVLLKSNDMEMKEENAELLATGEFFGVKSALGKYPRDETAIALSNAELLLFSPEEFEQLVLSNTRIIMKMLKVFSNQLRRTHRKVQNLISQDEQSDPETGLFSIGIYYLKNRRFSQAFYVFSRYLTYYPSGKHAVDVSKHLQIINQTDEKKASFSTNGE